MKYAALLVISLIAVAFLFFGCTSPTGSAVNSQAEADKTLADVGTDLSGINNSLEDIDNTLSGEDSVQ